MNKRTIEIEWSHLEDKEIVKERYKRAFYDLVYYSPRYVSKKDFRDILDEVLREFQE